MPMVADLLTWSPWRPLSTASTDATIPRSPGLYRIRRIGRADFDYIGETGNLRRRFGHLRGVYRDDMPFRDPHTAAPALWALRHATGCDFEVSVVPVDGSTPWRKGMEALAIGLYRDEHACSPTVQFGRMPPGYRPSSGNTARLVQQRKRFRGGPMPDLVHESHGPSLPPIGPLGGQPQAADWNGHAWSPWTPLTRGIGRATGIGSGLYRLRGDNAHTLLYIGEGQLPARPLAHLAKLRNPAHAQAQIIAAQTRFECSWVLNEAWLPHHRWELENDLIAAHLRTTGEIPTAQFLG